MREIIVDTETTGLSPGAGHRVVEIGCIELMNYMPTGREYHTYLDPERDMPTVAQEIHGLSAEFLTGKPKFHEIASAFLDFAEDSCLVMHNAGFDLSFLNAELARAQRPTLDAARCVDTVALARQKYPGQQASLDALCRRFGIDLSVREKHGALLDAKLLAQVYLELVGGREPGLSLAPGSSPALGTDATVGGGATPTAGGNARPARAAFPASAAELAAHAAFIARLKDPVWNL
jgi:DNA polymerase-3 subunit epsilon